MTRPSDDRSTPADWTRTPDCPFADVGAQKELEFRESPYWHALAQCRHIGIYKPKASVCTWIARVLTVKRRYVQHRLGSAKNGEPGALTYEAAKALAITWFQSAEVREIAQGTRPIGRTDTLNFCPIGQVYTVGSALSEYIAWSRIARTAGSHYNNLVLINYHLAHPILFEPLEGFSAQHVQDLARRILATHSSRAFKSRTAVDPAADGQRRAKRTFNAVVSILRVAFQNAWDNARISSDRPWRCLHRISVNPSVRTLFLDRTECRRLLDNCTPALARLVLAGLYTGCRVGELASLRVRDVGREVYGLHVPAFKLAPARFVFLPDEAMAFFLKCCEGRGPDDRLLRSDKGMVWSGQHANLFRRAVTLSGLPSEFVFHGLRHTYASDLVRQGVSLNLVARQLGHSDTRSVSQTYGHLAEEFREEQVRTRFSPLSEEFRAEARRMASRLDSLWTSVHRADWRDYGTGLDPGTRRPRSSARTSAEIVNVFSNPSGPLTDGRG
jgi:integrase/recombinase XerD